jgi:hypothetical protein
LGFHNVPPFFHKTFDSISVLREINREKEERNQQEHIEIRGTSTKKTQDEPEDRNRFAKGIGYDCSGHEPLYVRRMPVCCARSSGDANISCEKMVIDGPYQEKYHSSNTE